MVSSSTAGFNISIMDECQVKIDDPGSCRVLVEFEARIIRLAKRMGIWLPE
jgi:hypothetical protein